MPRARRLFVSGSVYELCFRARSGLPLPTLNYIRLLLESAIARTQRDDKVQVCHQVWMGNHAHMIVVSKDAKSLADFYGEIQKRITDYLKKALGIPHLDLWEGHAMASILLDPEKVIERIVYLYLNPARAHLVDSIERYPGLTSWRSFIEGMGDLDYESSRSVPWIRLPRIPRLPSRQLTKTQDRFLSAQLISRNQEESHHLTVTPNAWMKVFGITEGNSVVQCNQRIIELVTKEETRLRQTEDRTVAGEHRLTSTPIMRPHTPKKRQPQVAVMSSIAQLRRAWLRAFRIFSQRCALCYQEALSGSSLVEWPPGAFRPPIRPLSNMLSVI